MKTTTKAHDLGNNETASTGAIKQADGTWLALTYTQSKSFKTEQGAVSWLLARGYLANGERY